MIRDSVYSSQFESMQSTNTKPIWTCCTHCSMDANVCMYLAVGERAFKQGLGLYFKHGGVDRIQPNEGRHVGVEVWFVLRRSHEPAF